VQLQLARFELGQVEDVVEEPEQDLAAAVERRDELPSRGVRISWDIVVRNSARARSAADARSSASASDWLRVFLARENSAMLPVSSANQSTDAISISGCAPP
jgi:hypothetical protein